MSNINEVAELLGPLSGRFGVKLISLTKKRWDVAHERFPSRYLKEAKQDSKRTGSYFVGFEKGEKGLWPLLD